MIYDIAGIGIGPFNLGLAALLNPINDLKTIFFEKNDSFKWHPGMMIEGASLQVPFYADLVTLADPCSKFSIFAFLKSKKRLIRFSIYDNHYISRRLFLEYCTWVISQLNNLCFNQHVSSVTYDKDKECYKVRISGPDGHSVIHARHIVSGIGTEPYLPPCAQSIAGESLFHSSCYLHQKQNILHKGSVVIIGSGQSAAEIFYDLLQEFRSETSMQLNWITRSKRFYPMDYSKLSLEMTSPDYISYFFHLPEHKKSEVLKSQDTLYKGVNFSLISSIYERMYELSEETGNLPVRLLTNMEMHNISQLNDEYFLEFFQAEQEKYYRQKADAVIFATGYKNTFCKFFEPVKERIRWKSNGEFDIDLNYSIDIEHTEIFVQNAELLTHGFNAPDLGMGPYRNAIIINTILGYEYYEVEKKVAFQDFGI